MKSEEMSARQAAAKQVRIVDLAEEGEELNEEQALLVTGGRPKPNTCTHHNDYDRPK